MNQLQDEELELYFNKLMPPAMQRGRVEGQEIPVVSSLLLFVYQSLPYFLFNNMICSCCRSYLPVHLNPPPLNQKGTDTMMMTMTKYDLMILKSESLARFTYAYYSKEKKNSNLMCVCEIEIERERCVSVF